MTQEIFREDAYAKSCEATVTAVGEAGIELDRTVFYPTGGGQPGDSGVLRLSGGREIPIGEARMNRERGCILHVPVEGGDLPAVGDSVEAEIDWRRRHRLMRMHTTMHLLCARSSPKA